MQAAGWVRGQTLFPLAYAVSLEELEKGLPSGQTRPLGV